MSPLEVTQKVQLLKIEWRRGIIGTDTYHAKMANLRTIVASRNETC